MPIENVQPRKLRLELVAVCTGKNTPCGVCAPSDGKAPPDGIDAEPASHHTCAAKPVFTMKRQRFQSATQFTPSSISPTGIATILSLFAVNDRLGLTPVCNCAASW